MLKFFVNTRALYGPKFLGPARPVAFQAYPAKPSPACFLQKFPGPARFGPILDEARPSRVAIPLSASVAGASLI